MSCIDIQYYKTEIGELILGTFDNKLCLLDYRYRKMRPIIDKRLKNGLKVDYLEKDNEVLIQTREEIDQYLKGERKIFDVPLLLVGTDFQKEVWKALMDVQYGQTSSYLDLARKIKNEKAVRAVVGANGANSLSLVIPCHRIIGSNGELIGYGGGLPAKKRLLQLESFEKQMAFDDF